MDITSLQNARVKYIVKLREDKRQRQKDGLMLVDGFDEIHLALSAGHKPRTLLTAPDLASTQTTFPTLRLLPSPARFSRKCPTAKTPMVGWRFFQYQL